MEVHLFIFIHYFSKHVRFIYISVLLINSSFNMLKDYYVLPHMI